MILTIEIYAIDNRFQLVHVALVSRIWPLPVVAIAALSAPLHADPMPSTPFTLRFGGYGELGASLYNFGANANRANGAQRDLRLELDATRFVAIVQAATKSGWELEAELEIEHGGTGSSREIDYDEFGEFETELEKGGEVQLEELYLEKTFAGRYQLKVGKFYVGIGHLSSRFRPTEYLAATRSEMEQTVIPGQWDEMGASFTAFLGRVRVTAQVVNGLDSTGFSSSGWISTGHQAAYETIRATNLAGVVRADVEVAHGLELGAAGYAGGTSRNRPKADLVISCADGNPDVVAPCGYVSAPVTLAEVHGHLERNHVRATALALWGRLGNSDLITDRNKRLSNNAGVARTPVASQAYGLSLEAGVDIGSWVGLCPRYALEPFARVERYDTMYRTAPGVFDNARFQRTVGTVGAAFTIDKFLTFKLDVAHRRLGASELRPETTVHAVAGFIY